MFIQEIPFKHKKEVFYHGGGPILEQVPGKVVESDFVDIQNLIGYNPQRPALADPPLSRGVD